MNLTIRVPATTANLGPGFDSLGLALSIWNELEVRTAPGKSGISLSVAGFGAGTLPQDSQNLIVRAAHNLFSRAGQMVPALHCTSRNGFPSSSGLGSSSSAILMGLLAANAFLDDPLSQPALLDLANELEGHPDNVTPALLGGLTLSMVDAGQVVARRLLPAGSWRVAVAVPELAISTHAMRAALPKSVPLSDAVYNLSRSVLVVQALLDGDLPLLRQAMADRLHQPHRLPLIPGADAAMNRAWETGAAAALSGAGPGVAAFCAGEEMAEASASAMAQAFEMQGLRTWRWWGPVDVRGAEVARRP